MIKTTAMMLEELRAYARPADKLSRMVRAGECFKIVKGLYETNQATPGYLLAGSIYGPSYLSFEFALAYHGLIPEAVYSFTSATFEKLKKKMYETPFGTFTYRDVPSAVYPLGIEVRHEGDYSYQIASPEKALCDKLYTLKPVSNQKELWALLFEDLRMDENGLGELNVDDICILAEKYHSTNVLKLAKLLRRNRA